MGKDDVAQIRVDTYSVGIIGLRPVMEEMAEKFTDRPDDEAGEELVQRLQQRNYIPSGARESYKRAFVREFRRLTGKPVAEDHFEGLEIKVLGPGCAQCDRLEQEVISAMAETGLTGDVEHVRDIRQIGKYGVMGSPALIINGKVKSVGKVPPRPRVIEWLREAMKNGEEE